MVFAYSYHIAAFLEVHSKLGQLTHGHEYAVYCVLTELKSEKIYKKIFSMQR